MTSGLGSFSTDDPFDLPLPRADEGAYTQQDATFVVEYLRREGQSDAAVVACINARLSRPHEHIARTAEWMLSRPEIKAAIATARESFKSQVPVSGEVTRDTITADVEDIFKMAKDDRHYPAALNAKKLQAELHGLLKQDIQVTHRHMAVLPDEELERIAAKASTIDGEFKRIE